MEHRQPEEQYGFKSYGKTEDRLLTANMVIDNTLLANTPLWIARLDLSKAIDRADRSHLGRPTNYMAPLFIFFFNAVQNVVGAAQGAPRPQMLCSVLQLFPGRWRAQGVREVGRHIYWIYGVQTIVSSLDPRRQLVACLVPLFEQMGVTGTFNIEYACKIGIANFGTDKIERIAWLYYVNVQHSQPNTTHVTNGNSNISIQQSDTM